MSESYYFPKCNLIYRLFNVLTICMYVCMSRHSVVGVSNYKFVLIFVEE